MHQRVMPFLIAKSIVWLYHVLFVYSCIDGHFGYFQLLTMVNEAVSYKHLFTSICENIFSLLSGKYLGVKCLGLMIDIGLNV